MVTSTRGACRSGRSPYICYPQPAPNMFTVTAQHSAASRAAKAAQARCQRPAQPWGLTPPHAGRYTGRHADHGGSHGTRVPVLALARSFNAPVGIVPTSMTGIPGAPTAVTAASRLRSSRQL